MKYILALDQGTTSSRAILFNHAGSVVAVAQKEFPQIFPKPGWVEHDPDAIWSSQWEVTLGVLKKAGASAGDVAAIGIGKDVTLTYETAGNPPVNTCSKVAVK